ncbi:MAG: Sip1-related alpha-galactosidase, partial [Luteolibacter sp.]
VEAMAFDSLADLQNYKPSKTRKDHKSVQEGQFVLLQIKDGKYLALLPMTSDLSYSQFFMEKGKLLLKSGSFGTDAVKGDLPLLIWAYGDSPYSATREVWKQVIDSGFVSTDWRSNKPYPEPYAHLGWCSWEFYKTKISEKIIVDAAHTLEASEAPFRWLMVDDGYFNEEGRRLIDFSTDKKKFPNGWKPITDLKNPEKLKWMGVWRNTIGYMSGISNKNTMDDISEHLVKTANGKAMVPKGTQESTKAFHDKMAKDAIDNGFDFTKVDFQTKAFDIYKGMGNAVSAVRANNDALEAACEKYELPLLNCIAQPNVNSLQTKYSALMRSSPDYNQSDKDKNKCNTYQSFANHLWMGQTVWGDLDMFHSHDERDVQPMAIARAISGGPVYISDEPSKIVADVLIPFAFEDGRLLRTRAPATLLPESFFIHPFRGNDVFRVVAPLEDNVAAIALFNFTEAAEPLTETISADDYPHAGELLQPTGAPWTQPEGGLLIYDRDAKKMTALDGDFESEVGDFGAKLFLLYPNTEGWAVVGRIDKYLPSAAVKVHSVSENEIVFTLHESGPLAIWSETGAPKMEGAEFREVSDKLYVADLEVKIGAKEITVTR